MSMDEIQETQLQAEIGRAPSEESSGKRRKLENKEVENQEQAIFSHAESFQMTIDSYAEENRLLRLHHVAAPAPHLRLAQV